VGYVTKSHATDGIIAVNTLQDKVEDIEDRSITITQIAHGFTVVGTPIYETASVWTPADAATITTAAEFIITEIVDVDNFKVGTIGKLTITGHGFTINNTYYLADTPAGTTLTDYYTSTIPTVVGDVHQKCFTVIDSDVIYMSLQDAYEIPAAGAITLQPSAVNQVTHGFAIGDAVFNNAGVWTAALTDTLANSATGIIMEVADVDNFAVATTGTLGSTAHGFTIGDTYYLNNIGIFTNIKPSNVGDIVQQCFEVVDINNLYISVQPAYLIMDLTGGVLVNQVLHGFTVGTPVYNNAGVWTLADAAAIASTAYMVVSEVVDVDNFKATTVGELVITAHGLTLDSIYYLADTPAGPLVTDFYTVTEPVTAGDVYQKCLYVIDVNTLYIDLQEAYVITDGVTGALNSSFVTQTTHGFAVGDAILNVGAAWVPALTDVIANAAQVMVMEVIDVDTFRVATTGNITITTHGFTVDELYYLDATGVFTDTPTAVIGEIVQQCFQVIDTDNIYVKLENAYIIGAVGPALYTGVDTTANILLLDPAVAETAGERWWSSDEFSEYRPVAAADAVGGVAFWKKIDIKYDAGTDTYSITDSADGQSQDIGQEIFFVASNNSGTSATALDPNVFKSTNSLVGNEAYKEIVPVDSTDLEDGNLFGLNTTEALDAGFTKILVFGDMNDVNTAAWVVGDILYVSPTIKGALTNVRPDINAWAVASVTKVHATEGKLFINGIGSNRKDAVVVPAGYSRKWFTADSTTIVAGTFFETKEDKGIIAADTQVQSVDDNVRSPLGTQWITEPMVIDTDIPLTSYNGQIEFEIDDDKANEKLYIEVYLADNNGNVLDSGSGLPNGDTFGFPPITVLTSSLLNMKKNVTVMTSLTGVVGTAVVVLAGQRVVYSILVEKVGTDGGAKGYTVYFGTNHQTYVDTPFKYSSDDIVNDSIITGGNVTNALDKTMVHEFNYVSGTEYALNTVVQDAGWLMIANKT
ncbi:MAG: hypothetical protein DRQ64_09170, partial [Gammaproteobacteria bacterium]